MTPLAVVDVVRRFLRALGVTAASVPATEGEAIALYRTLLAGRRVLIIADNASSAEQVAPLVPPMPTSALVATSRPVLAMLDGAVHIGLRPLSPPDARQLLGNIAGHDRIRTETAAVAAVSQACGHLPLALRVAGARLVTHPQWTVAHLANRLADERRILNELNTADETLRASLWLSWRELRADGDPLDALAARVFLALGAVRLPTVSVGLVAAVCDTASGPIELALDRLVEVRLVERDGDYFRMHDLVRLFAAELAAADPDRPQRLRAALAWYAAAADQVGRLVRGVTRELGAEHRDSVIGVVDAPSAGAWLDGERANIVALARQALVESSPVSRSAAQLVLGLYPAILMRGHAYEWEVLCRLVVDAADRVQEPTLIAYAYTRLAVTLAIQLRADEALECVERGLPLHRLGGDRSGAASALETAGMVSMRLGRPADALARFEDALRLRTELGDRFAEGITLSNAAEAYHTLGRSREALDCLERSLEIRHEFGDLAGEAITYLNMGEVLAGLGQVSDALRMADASVEYSRKAGDRENERRCLALRARLRIGAGDIGAALADCEDVLRLTAAGGASDLDDLIAALEAAAEHETAGRLRRRAAGSPQPY
jgi:tetratricopeptide (TPR) repeat protein